MALSDVKEWVSSIVGQSAYTYTYGMWVETTATHANWYCVIQATGGAAPDVEDRRPRYRVILLGRRNERSDGVKVLADAEALMQASLGGITPCGAANIRAMGEPIGPGFTTENRAWAQIDFEVLL